MIARLAAFAALILCFLAPPGPVSLLGALLIVVLLLSAGEGDRASFGLLGLPGDWAAARGGRAP